MHTTSHLQTLFEVSATTIKNWCREFTSYLSPTATPERNRQRQFTDNDLAVLSLVAELKTAGATYEAIHAALAAGQRGDIPASDGIVTAETPAAMLALREQVEMLRNELAAARGDILRQAGKIELLEKWLTDAQNTIRQLEREAGKRESTE